MSKLEVKENKKLVLKQVLVRKLNNVAMDQLDGEIRKFANYIQLLKVNTFGPLITMSSGINIHEDGTCTINYEMMVQAHDYKQYNKNLTTHERLKFSNCVYLRFQGRPEDIGYANSKLDLYFYENDLSSSGIQISVFISESPDEAVIDFFRPVAKL